MSETAEYKYVFIDLCVSIGQKTRWSWIESYLSELEVFVKAIEARRYGGTTFPILVGAAIDFISDLYAGDTEYLHCKKNIKGKTCQSCGAVIVAASSCTCGLRHFGFEQGDVACKFMTEFFDGIAGEIPHIIWDGLRNGMTHVSMPKQFAGGSSWLSFGLAGPGSDNGLQRDGDGVKVFVDPRGLLEALKAAVKRYEEKLRTNQDLQRNFRNVWKEVENYPREAKGAYETEMNRIFDSAKTGWMPLFDPSVTL